METTFLELRCKEVVNVIDGRRLGHVTDVVFSLSTFCVQGIVVPGEKNGWNIFKKGCELFIPFKQVIKIGEDMILVEVYGTNDAPQNPFILSTPPKK